MRTKLVFVALLAFMVYPALSFGAGTVSGKITYTGTPAKQKPIDMSKEPSCAKQHATPVTTETVVTGANNTLANVVVYISLVLVPVTSYLLTRTGLGLRVRAVGENPRAADTMGINVSRLRYFATMTGVILAGVSGAYLAVGYTGSFQLGYTLGRGFIALAMVYLSNWNPYKAFAAIFIYDFVDSLQSAVVINTPALESSSYLLALLPYIFVLVLIPVFGRKARAPKYLTIPYSKD